MFWLFIFSAVFINNIIPIFAPPTWLVLSYAAVTFGASNIFLLAFMGALAATCGRLLLALFSNRIIRNNFLSERSIKNIDDLKRHLEHKKALTFGIFLFYAFSPLSSSQLFIAYGLTKMRLRLIAFPFFIGRLISYAVLAFTSLEISGKFAYSKLKTSSFFTGYFIFSQLMLYFLVYLFVKIDWHSLFMEKKLKIKK